LVFYAALFPRLARFMPHVRKARDEDLKDGKINQETYDNIESLERNHISSISTAHSNIGYLVTLGINLPVLLSLRGKDYSNNIALGLTNTCKFPDLIGEKELTLADWIVLGIWWFIFQQPRPGPKMPEASTYATIGFKQVLLAIREVKHLPQTFTYLVAFFLLADGLNTTGTLVGIIQNNIVNFSFLDITYLGLSQAICSIVSTFGFWYLQQFFKIKTKHMFMLTNIFSVLIPFYGMLGIWTDVVGYHHVRDFWVYNIVFGFFQAPYYAYSQTMMSEVTPRGYENMFFGLFGITNRAVSYLDPVSVTISDVHDSLASSDQMSCKQSSIPPITPGWGFRFYSRSVPVQALSFGSSMLKRAERTVELSSKRETLPNEGTRY